MENQAFSFSDVIPVIKKRFKYLLILGVIAAVLSAVFSGPSFIKPRYESYGVYYPSNLWPYADESATEQLIQLFEANSIKDTLIKKFNLYDRYEITQGDPASRHSMLGMLSERISMDKTRYESVSVKVSDESPDTAYLMAQEIVNQVNLKARYLQRAKSVELVKMRERQRAEQEAFMNQVDEKLKAISTEHGILEFEAQTQEVTQGLYRMLAAGKGGYAVKKAEELLKALQEKGAEYQTLYDLKEYLVEFYGEVEVGYQSALNDSRKDLTYTNEIVKPEIADKKSYPVRWIIVFTAVFCTVFAALVLFLIFDNKSSLA